jgi:putative transposase
MQNNRDFHHRKSIRLQGYDYRQPGGYFITIVAHQGESLFGAIIGEEFKINSAGMIVQSQWQKLPRWFPITLDVWVLMPNHIHGILLIDEISNDAHIRSGSTGGNASQSSEPIQFHLIGTDSHSLGSIVQNFKSTTTRLINRSRKSPGEEVWQRNYYEHIIRNDKDLERIRRYILDNPIKWAMDVENPNRIT